MLHKNIPCCYFPCTIVFVDDNKNFLNSLKLELDEKTAFYHFFDQPMKALQFLNKENSSPSFLNRCLTYPDGTEFDHCMINVSIPRIHHEIYNQQRFQEVSVVVVDYAMPGMTGLEVCQQLNLPHVKTVLLTGEADETIAINAFNEGLISYFIRKDDINFGTKLNQALADLQRQYFIDLSEVIMRSINTDSQHASILNEPAFINYFNKIWKELDIQECYLLEQAGSFLLIDQKCKLHWLLVNSEDLLESFAEYAEDSPQETPAFVREALKNREQLVYFYNETNVHADPGYLQKYLYPVTCHIEGHRVYHCALILKMRSPCFKHEGIEFSDTYTGASL
jgi:CheY-like chemotaxis protein